MKSRSVCVRAEVSPSQADKYPIFKPDPIGILKAPALTSTPKAFAAPVHIPSGFPSLARTRETVALSLLATQRSAPSERRSSGMVPTGVVPRSVAPLRRTHCRCLDSICLPEFYRWTVKV